MKKIRTKLTYANVMATVAVFIALGGASYAAIKLPKNSVGTKQIKNGAVTGAKIKKGSVTANSLAPGAVTQPAINPATLGTVPSATNAAHAVTADNAAHAAAADNASTLQGVTAAQITASSKLTCPSETIPEAGVCFQAVPTVDSAFPDAQESCAAQGRRLPTPSEQEALVLAGKTEFDEWAGQEFVNGATVEAIFINVNKGKAEASHDAVGIGHLFRCVTDPTN